MTTVVFRTAASPPIGFGHLRRCLSLAEALRDRCAECTFVMPGDSRALETVRSEGFDARTVTFGKDLEILRHCKPQAIVADSYEIDHAYYKALRELVETLVAVEDAGDGDLPVDMLINTAVGAEHAYDASRIPVRLLGPRYALLRREFEHGPPRVIPPRVARILVTLGGGDPLGLTPSIVEWVAGEHQSVDIDVVAGPLVVDTSALECVSNRFAPRVHLHRNPRDIRALMLAADLAISGGGQTTYELAATGTPSIALCLAENQRAGLQSLGAQRVLQAVEYRDREILHAELLPVISAMIDDRERRAEMSARGRALVDGKGAGRVAAAILEWMGGNR